MKYADFVASKLVHVPPTGIVGAVVESPHLFDFQRDLIQWALRRGRAAIFANAGLGKTRQQLTWADHVARHTGKRVLILAPLSVAQQTVREAMAIGVHAIVAREQSDIGDAQIVVTNYERMHKFDLASFGGVALDESSIIKSKDSKTLRILIESFRETPFKLCLTATPSPNDFVELGTHAEFLGICTQVEMLAEFFVHDGGETQKWRLKGHARKEFWKFVASWAALVRSPADLGYNASAYELPKLHVHHHVIEADDETTRAAGLLFASEANTLMERRSARKGSIGARVKACADLVNASDDPWIVWCDLNAESEALTKAIKGAIEVTGSLDVDEKERRIWSFLNQESYVVVGKASIFGFGINAQHCAHMAFVGVTDSWESYYQAVRRCWRFGQKREVHVHIFASELDGAVVKNLQRKEEDARVMAEELSRETADVVRAEITGSKRRTGGSAATKRVRIPAWMENEP